MISDPIGDILQLMMIGHAIDLWSSGVCGTVYGEVGTLGQRTPDRGFVGMVNAIVWEGMSDHACKPPGTWRYAIYVIVNDCHVAANYGLHLELHYYIHTVLIFHTFSTTICVFCRFSSSLPTKLLHLIEQQHTVGSASNRLSELATFLSYGSTTNPLDPLDPLDPWVPSGMLAPHSQHIQVERQSNERLRTSPCTLTCPWQIEFPLPPKKKTFWSVRAGYLLNMCIIGILQSGPALRTAAFSKPPTTRIMASSESNLGFSSHIRLKPRSNNY